MSIWGLASNPFDCWLAERGLATLPLRMRAASANAAALADWLAEQPGVTRVDLPRPAGPPRPRAGRRRAATAASATCSASSWPAAARRSTASCGRRRGIPFSPSLGHTTTTCSHPATTSHRYVSPAEKRRQGITDGLIRLSVGVEDLTASRRRWPRGCCDGWRSHEGAAPQVFARAGSRARRGARAQQTAKQTAANRPSKTKPRV